MAKPETENQAQQQTAQQKTEDYKKLLREKYKERGFQKLSLEEYEALKATALKKKQRKIPPHIQFILGTPFLIIFCFGLFYLPYLLYVAATSPADSMDKAVQKSKFRKDRKNDSRSLSTGAAKVTIDKIMKKKEDR